MRVLLFLAAASSLGAQPLDWRPIMRASLERMVESDARMADYSFDRQVVKKEFEPDGRLKLQTTTLMRPERVEGVWISRIITLDGKPLTDVEKRRQEDAIRRRINEEKGQQSRPPSILGRENDELIRLFPEALEYRLLGEELKDGRKTWVLACQPRPGYKPTCAPASLKRSGARCGWIRQTKIWSGLTPKSSTPSASASVCWAAWRREPASS
jgi:hypothetical protein